jgi:hypothetical protein
MREWMARQIVTGLEREQFTTFECENSGIADLINISPVNSGDRWAWYQDQGNSMLELRKFQGLSSSGEPIPSIARNDIGLFLVYSVRHYPQSLKCGRLFWRRELRAWKFHHLTIYFWDIDIINDIKLHLSVPIFHAIAGDKAALRGGLLGYLSSYSGMSLIYRQPVLRSLWHACVAPCRLSPTSYIISRRLSSVFL